MRPSETAQHEASPDAWRAAGRPLPAAVPPPAVRRAAQAGPEDTLYLARDPDSGQARYEPEPLFSCPCPSRGLRCGDCMMIAFGSPPFSATPLGWFLASFHRLRHRLIIGFRGAAGEE
jgi:hypothetical protein